MVELDTQLQLELQLQEVHMPLFDDKSTESLAKVEDGFWKWYGRIGQNSIDDLQAKGYTLERIKLEGITAIRNLAVGILNFFGNGYTWAEAGHRGTLAHLTNRWSEFKQKNSMDDFETDCKLPGFLFKSILDQAGIQSEVLFRQIGAHPRFLIKHNSEEVLFDLLPLSIESNIGYTDIIDGVVYKQMNLNKEKIRTSRRFSDLKTAARYADVMQLLIILEEKNNVTRYKPDFNTFQFENIVQDDSKRLETIKLLVGELYTLSKLNPKGTEKTPQIEYFEGILYSSSSK